MPALAIDHCVPLFHFWLACGLKLDYFLDTEEERCQSVLPVKLVEENTEDSMYNRKL